MADKVCHLAVADGVATITLDSPSNRNALSAQMRQELLANLLSAIADTKARVIVLTHTGTVFSSGMDLKEFRGRDGEDEADRKARMVASNQYPTILEKIMTAPKPVVARIAGSAFAGGLGMVVAADIAVAVHEAKFSVTEVRLGLVAGMMSVPFLLRIPKRASRELFLTGEAIGAERAETLGIINRAVPADQLDAEVGRYLDMLRLGGPRAMAATKWMLGETEMPAVALTKEFRERADFSSTYFASEEGQEGARAFAEKRKPGWTII